MAVVLVARFSPLAKQLNRGGRRRRSKSPDEDCYYYFTMYKRIIEAIAHLCFVAVLCKIM